uniref:Transmembrane protein 107 n=1 Tax=Guillardia theta TaxID=55529 RepID=A0A7S4UJ92_GUITH|mmetsp:Transcript_52658/g.163418  ORF Transcript_52658/g.163418 Transcript_52658/m.163418 type:complete len:115 (+) Transcript_52658:46-390(+)
MKAFDALIPTRFMASICFLISVMMVFSTMADNIIVSLPSTYSQTSYDSYKSSLNLVLSLHIICICFNLAGFLFGFSMFIPSHTILVIISHTIGCIYSCVAIMETWSVPSTVVLQ